MKSAKENFLDVIRGKNLLFLENDLSLEYGLDEVEKFLKENKIKYKVLFNLSERRMSTITKAIEKADVILFQTQWVYPISQQLFGYIKSLDRKRDIIEVPINEPTWFYKPQTIHDVYFVQPFGPYMDRDGEWSFIKLSDEPFWDYKNKFDK